MHTFHITKWYALQTLVSQTLNTLYSLCKYDDPAQHSTCVQKLTFDKYILYITVTCRVLAIQGVGSGLYRMY